MFFLVTLLFLVLFLSGWGDWSDWSACNVSCDTGVQYRQRRCLKCGQGHNKEFRKCNDFPCDGTLNVICLSRRFSYLVEFSFDDQIRRGHNYTSIANWYSKVFDTTICMQINNTKYVFYELEFNASINSELKMKIWSNLYN